MVVNHYLTTRQTPRMTIQICRLSATPERAWDRFRGLGFYSMVCFLAFSRLVVRTSGCLAIITRPTLPRCVARPRMHSKRGLELHEQFQNPSDVFQRRNVLISFIGSIGSHLFPPRQSENKEKYSVPLPFRIPIHSSPSGTLRRRGHFFWAGTPSTRHAGMRLVYHARHSSMKVAMSSILGVFDRIRAWLIQ